MPAKVDIADWFDIDDNGCWIPHTKPYGNGYSYLGKREPGKSKVRLAHRFFYEQIVGPIPEGLQLDHLCKVTRCVNPDHLEPVTPRENTMRSDAVTAAHARKTHCIHGHEFTVENTRMKRAGRGRDCRACDADRQSRRYRRA